MTKVITSDQQLFLTSSDLAARWRMSLSALGMMRPRGTGPTFASINGRILYYLESVLEMERPHRTTAEAYAERGNDPKLEARQTQMRTIAPLGREKRRQKREERAKERQREAPP